MSNLLKVNSNSLVSQFIDKHNLLVSQVHTTDDTDFSQNRDPFFYSHQAFNAFFGAKYSETPKFKLPPGLNIRDAKNPLPLTNITNSLFGTILHVGQEARTYFQSKLTYSTYKGMRAPLRSKTRGAKVYRNSTIAVKVNSKPRDYGLKLVAFI